LVDLDPDLLPERGMMRDALPFDSSIRPREAEDSLALDTAQLYVMPTPQDRREDNPLPFPVKAGKLIVMPARWSITMSARPQRQFHGNTVDWPRGYPAHDDL